MKKILVVGIFLGLVISSMIMLSSTEKQNLLFDENDILLATSNYVTENNIAISNEIDVPVSLLKKQGYLDEDVKLPGNDTLETVCVKITKTNENESIKHIYEYKYSNSGC